MSFQFWGNFVVKPNMCLDSDFQQKTKTKSSKSGISFENEENFSKSRNFCEYSARQELARKAGVGGPIIEHDAKFHTTPSLIRTSVLFNVNVRRKGKLVQTPHFVHCN